MTPPMLVALDLAAVLILSVLVAELARMRFRPPARLQPVAVMAEPVYEFCRPAEFGPLAVSRGVIDSMRDAIFCDQLMAISHKRYSRWPETDRKQWIREWVEHERDDYVSSLTSWGLNGTA